MEYMYIENNHKFRKADNIINLHDIVILKIYFTYYIDIIIYYYIDVNPIKMLINNNDANVLVIYSLMLLIIWRKEGWRKFREHTLKIISTNE